MRTIIVTLALVSCTIATHVPVQLNGSSSTPSSYQSTSNEDLQSVNDRIMERLRQEVGSERGVYHVYLPDGRLQRVQYTTAPLASQQEQPAQVSTGPYSANQESVQANLGLDRGVNTYYVEVPAERLDAIRAAQAAGQQQQYQLQRQAVGNNGYSAQYYQPLEVNAQFAPLTVVTPEQLAEYRAGH